MSEEKEVTVENGQRTIELGDYIIIQRQNYYKLTKFSDLDITVALGRDKLLLKGLLHHPYSARFKMCPTSTVKMKKGNSQRIYTLELCNELETNNIYSILEDYASGTDNRNISDVGDSQALDMVEIDQLRDECTESAKIIEKIVENSKTFQSKTEYSQEKYLQRKESKYFEYIEIQEPSIRLMSEIYYRQDPEKIMGLRYDMLSQIVAYSGVCGYGNYLLYESGTNGLVPATLLNSIGSGTEASLVHMHPGNIPQTQAMLALNLPKEQLDRCISVNIYSVLRAYYQREKPQDQNTIENNEVLDSELPGSPCSKKARISKIEVEVKLSNSDEEVLNKLLDKVNGVNVSKGLDGDENSNKLSETWREKNERACRLMLEKGFDSLIVISKEHPENIVKELLPFVKLSRPIVVYSPFKETLMNLYNFLKSTTKVINIRLTSNWLRSYQVLLNRTHPHINMTSNSGYLLTGYTVG